MSRFPLRINVFWKVFTSARFVVKRVCNISIQWSSGVLERRVTKRKLKCTEACSVIGTAIPKHEA